MAPATLDALCRLLVDVVAGGGSVGFMHPLGPDQARAYWRDALTHAQADGRVVLGAFVDDALAATVTLHLDTPPNQPHRAEIWKLMTASAHRGRGIAARLMREAERIAADRGRTLLNLDTAVEHGAAGFYEKLGYVRVGEIPGYALRPLGELVGTAIYYRIVEPIPPSRA